MAHTIYATFATEKDAERAAAALMDQGVAQSDVSFVLPDRMAPAQTDFAGGLVPSSPAPTMLRDAPVSTLSGTDVVSDIPIPTPFTPSTPGNVSPSAVNAGSLTAAESVGFQPNTGYEVSGPGLDGAVHVPVAVVGPVGGVTGGPTLATHAAQIAQGHPGTLDPRASDTPIDAITHDTSHVVDMNRHLHTDSASGITTTTPADAAKGAIEGTGLGLAAGLLLAAIALPGIGLVAGAGMLAAGLVAATGAAGGIAGGVYGYLADRGVPPERAQHYHESLEAGHSILSVTISGPVSQQEIVMLLNKYGAVSAEAF